MFETIVKHAVLIASHWSLNKGLKNSLSNGVFDLFIESSDGTPLSANHFMNFAEIILATMSSEFVGTFTGYMILDMTSILNFDLHIKTELS